MTPDLNHLLLSKNFHVDFIRKYGAKNWYVWISGGGFDAPRDPVLAMFGEFETSSTKGKKSLKHYAQSEVQWTVPDFRLAVPQNDFELDSDIVLNSGSGFGEFIKSYAALFKKYDTKNLIYEVEESSDGARDSAYNSFPGVASYPEEAYFMLDRLLKKNAEPQKIYNMYLATGYVGDNDLRKFTDWLLEHEAPNKAAEDILEALTGGIQDAYASQVKSTWRDMLIEAIKSFDFNKAIIAWDDYDKWEVKLEFDKLLNIIFSLSCDKDGSIKYFDLSERDIIESIYGDEKISLPETYPDASDLNDDIDVYYGYDYFLDNFPDKILESAIL